jgi:hypothetical protein
MRIVSFDPGEHTGFCEANVDGDTFEVVKSTTIVWEERFELVPQLLVGTDKAPLPDVIVVEMFRLYGHKAQAQVGNDFPSSQMIGVIQTYAHMLNLLDKVVLQPASVMSRVKILDEHAPSLHRSEHARDAYKHLRYYVVTEVR